MKDWTSDPLDEELSIGSGDDSPTKSTPTDGLSEADKARKVGIVKTAGTLTTFTSFSKAALIALGMAGDITGTSRAFLLAIQGLTFISIALSVQKSLESNFLSYLCGFVNVIWRSNNSTSAAFVILDLVHKEWAAAAIGGVSIPAGLAAGFAREGPIVWVGGVFATLFASRSIPPLQGTFLRECSSGLS